MDNPPVILKVTSNFRWSDFYESEAFRQASQVYLEGDGSCLPGRPGGQPILLKSRMNQRITWKSCEFRFGVRIEGPGHTTLDSCVLANRQAAIESSAADLEIMGDFGLVSTEIRMRNACGLRIAMSSVHGFLESCQFQAGGSDPESQTGIVVVGNPRLSFSNLSFDGLTTHLAVYLDFLDESYVATQRTTSETQTHSRREIDLRLQANLESPLDQVYLNVRGPWISLGGSPLEFDDLELSTGETTLEYPRKKYWVSWKNQRLLCHGWGQPSSGSERPSQTRGRRTKRRWTSVYVEALKLLGLEEAAGLTRAQVNSGFRKQARLWHPDKSDQESRAFIELREAQMLLLSTCKS